MTKLTIETWTANVQAALNDLKSKIDNNDKAKALYGGFYIWDSKLIENPEIMFIGINPGNGNPNNHGQIVTDQASQMSYLEYLDGENPSFKLAKETVVSFEMAGFSISEIIDLFNEKSIKTNFHYIITNDHKDIGRCMNLLENYSSSEFWKKSYEWTGQLIGICNPKVIICEGRSVFDYIMDFDDVTENEWKDDCGYLIRPNGQVIIGYARTFSNIKNKPALAELIKRFIKKLHSFISK